MNGITTELDQEFRIVEKQVRDQYSVIFDHIEDELLARWLPIWKEHGFDTSKIRLRVTPRIEVSVLENVSKEEHE